MCNSPDSALISLESTKQWAVLRMLQSPVLGQEFPRRALRFFVGHCPYVSTYHYVTLPCMWQDLSGFPFLYLYTVNDQKLDGCKFLGTRLGIASVSLAMYSGFQFTLALKWPGKIHAVMWLHLPFIFISIKRGLVMKIQISGLLPASLLIHSLINSIPDDNCSCCKHTSGNL